ncbi:MAG TPA: hypothetical protein VLC79_05200, partial [Cellvibrio sp.]|nr:hypothetical protein [Cellvibrio sp.]
MKNIYILIFMLLFSSLSLGGELEDRREISRVAKELMLHGSFSELENLASMYRDTEERTSSGLWKLTLFYGAFGDVNSNEVKDEKNWNELVKNTDLWITAYPKSPTPYIVKALVLKKEAWAIRGVGYSNTVAPSAWKPFYEKIELSRNVLEESKLISSEDPHWHSTMAEIATIQAWDEVEFKKFTNQSFSKFPNYFQLYFNAMNYYTPKWRGSADKVEIFATEIMEKTKSKEGFGMYARIYWYASQSQFQGKLFEKSKVRWDIMSKGIDDVLNKFPDQWNINSFA